MAMQAVYLVAAKNLSKFLDALRHAQAPPKLTLKFIEELGFASTNDRLFIPLLRAMKFIDEGGKPTARYHAFLDETQWKRVLAEGIRNAYPDLFRVNRDAQTMTRDQITGKVRSLSEGQASTSVVANTVKTFVELVKLADFSVGPDAPTPEMPTRPASQPDAGALLTPEGLRPPMPPGELLGDGSGAPTLVYRIEIVLPAVRDQAVYDAIFRSARAHLLR
jgi:hypothetical protein